MDDLKKPDGLKSEHLTFLDDLRESGIVNMYGARPYLADEFGLDKNEAGAILAYWMKTFGQRHSVAA